MNVIDKLSQVQLMPLYTATDLSVLDKVAEILISNKVPFIEVTFRSELAGEAIKQLSQYKDLIVGAGTVRSVEQVKTAVENGAQFIVSPAISRPVIEYCLKNDILIIPGTATPRDIQIATEYGLDIVKFFPADVYGGLAAIKALSGPFYDVKFLPTGGINSENMLDYLSYKPVIAVGGSFILSEADVLKDNGEAANNKLKSIVEKLNA